MWLNEFKTGDIVEDRFGNVVEIKQIFKTGNVKIKILKSDMLEISDFVGNTIDKNSVGKTYTVYPFGEFENDWYIKVEQKVEELTVEQIDSKISELQKKKEEIVKNQLNNLVPGKFYQIVDNEDGSQVGMFKFNNECYYFDVYYDDPAIDEIIFNPEDIKSIKPLPELDEAYSKFLKLLEKFT